MAELASLLTAQDLQTNSSTQKHTLGTRAWDTQGSEYIYLKGVASTVVTDVVTYDAAYATSRATKALVDKLYPCAIAMSACVANEFGWYCISGQAEVNCLTLCAKEKALYSSGTPGSLDDTSTSQTKINRIVSVDTLTTTLGDATCLLYYPSAA